MTRDDMRRLLEPYLAPGEGLRPIKATESLLASLEAYLHLLLQWNQRMNLTAVRRSEEIVPRHFGESLLLARLLPPGIASVLDLGSGAGFPGLPLQLGCPEVHVTLAESQSRKAIFLREVVRKLGLSTEVWGGRAEDLLGEREFGAVTLRAVDDMQGAVRLAGRLGGRMLLLSAEANLSEWELPVLRSVRIPQTDGSVAALCASSWFN